jgi:hypothetical protein
MLLARRFTLNPVLIILSLVFWFWMWGVVGAILAVPMLAILKIICDRLRPLKALGHFLEGREHCRLFDSHISLRRQRPQRRYISAIKCPHPA